MMQPNRELTALARTALRGNWGMAVVFTLAFGLICTSAQLVKFISPYLSGAIILITWPLAIGYYRYLLRLTRGEKTDLGDALKFGFTRIGETFGTLLLYVLYTVPAMLLMVLAAFIAGMLMPLSGIASLFVGVVLGIAAIVFFFSVVLNYAQAYFLLAEEERLSPRQILQQSKALMRGHRWQFVCLGCRLIGWIVLGVLACGVGLLWVYPYLTAAYAAFYEALKTPQSEEAVAEPPPSETPSAPPYRMKPHWTVLLILLILGWGAGIQLINDFSGLSCQQKLANNAKMLTAHFDRSGQYQEQPFLQSLNRLLLQKKCPTPWGSDYLVTAPLVTLPADKAARGRTLLLLEYPGNHFGETFYTIDGNGSVRRNILPPSLKLLPYLELNYDLNDAIREKIAQHLKKAK